MVAPSLQKWFTAENKQTIQNSKAFLASYISLLFIKEGSDEEKRKSCSTICCYSADSLDTADNKLRQRKLAPTLGVQGQQANNLLLLKIRQKNI